MKCIDISDIHGNLQASHRFWETDIYREDNLFNRTALKLKKGEL